MNRAGPTHSGDPDGHRAGKRRHLHAQRLFAVPALTPTASDLPEVSGVALNVLLFHPGDAGGLSRRDSKAWLFSLVSTVAFGLLTYMIVGGTLRHIIASHLPVYSVYWHYSRLDFVVGCWRRRACWGLLAWVLAGAKTLWNECERR